MSRFTSAPTVSVVTSHGRQELPVGPDDRLVDVLKRAGVPWSAVSAYAVPRSGGEAVGIPSLDGRLADFSGAAEVLLYFNRNVNPFLFSHDQFVTAASDHPGEEATEYLYQDLRNERGDVETVLKKLSPQECRQIIADRVADTVREHVPAGSTLVVGISGGGDSNALLHGLSLVKDHVSLDLVILKGLPDWDAGVPRALELCASYGLDLTVVEAEEVKTLLGIPVDDPISLVDRFEREFPGDDFEFLGTLLIRLALADRARSVGTRYICTGLNLEDVLCEALFRVSSGLRPAPFPVRDIDDVTLVTPLWLCPKRIIDGCFPKHSRDNYDARYPCFSLGRNLYYSVVYTLQSTFPGYVEQLARGLSELSLADPVEYTPHPQLGFPVERSVPFPLVRRFQRMLHHVSTGS